MLDSGALDVTKGGFFSVGCMTKHLWTRFGGCIFFFLIGIAHETRSACWPWNEALEGQINSVTRTKHLCFCFWVTKEAKTRNVLGFDFFFAQVCRSGFAAGEQVRKC